MAKLKDFRVLTFDCYGTIIDWETGVLAAMQPLLDRVGHEKFSRKEVLDTMYAVEGAQQKKTPDLLYAALLATIYPEIASRLGDTTTVSAAEAKAFGDAIGQWSAFPDSVAALRRLAKHYKLVILSNVDRESFSATNAGPLEGLPFDLILTAQDIGSYKPDPRNFAYMIDKVHEAFGVDKTQILQTAQSQYHDHHPAHAAGLRSVWINRPGAVMGNTTDSIYDWKFATLQEMADAVDAEA